MDIKEKLRSEFDIAPTRIDNIVSLIDEGNTIPFIARYRKEMTGNCDDQVLREFADRLTYLRNLEKRKGEVEKSITEQGKMTEEITAALAAAETMTEVEDIYRPYKQKKKTRASVAVEKGLTPLAEEILKQEITLTALETLAESFVSEEKKVGSVKEAIQGAKDIIAEMVSDNAELRKKLRAVMAKNGAISAKMADKDKEESKIFEMYSDFYEGVSEIPSHRILALNRGEKAGVLSVKLELNRVLALNICNKFYIKNEGEMAPILRATVEDSYDRLLFPSIEREVRSELTDRASEQAISMFEANLKQLLLQPPVKDKVTIGLDPAYRTGCKIAVVDGHGKVLDTTVIFPTKPQERIAESEQVLTKLIDKYAVDVIAIGNGTASKESEIFVNNLIKKLDRKVEYMMVSEAGASVYSASKLAVEEFPDFDLTKRSAISIARRLQDPLAELIKIDPKSIGVGQYQHDMPAARLDAALSGVLEDCVNSVGVDLNTASAPLLTYVSGLNASVAKNVVAYREQNGAFTAREQIKKVKGVGEKAYVQCAGFLRIPGGENILDNTAVHPESYEACKKLLDFYGMTEEDIRNKKVADKLKKVNLTEAMEKTGLGEETLKDVIVELSKPGRDIRDELPKPMLRSDIMDINDLKEGMILKGTVRNITDFGAFVDISVHQDGLVHISEICDRYIKHPLEALKVGEVVDVKVLGVDRKKNRISLSIKQAKGKKK